MTSNMYYRKGHAVVRAIARIAPRAGRVAPFAALFVALFAVSGTGQANGWRLAGAEFNPVRSMPRATSPGGDGDQGVRWLSLSGTARLADDPGRDEIAIPFAWSARRGVGDVDRLAFELDVQYRRFLARSNHGGLYAGPLLRIAHRRGYERGGGGSASAGRLGAGLVIGVRLPMASEHHWDLSFSHGRFLGLERPPETRDPMRAAVAIDDVFTDRAVLRLVRRF